MAKTRHIAHDGQRVEPIKQPESTLACGCTTKKPPALSNPDKWWCCHAWQRRKQ